MLVCVDVIVMSSAYGITCTVAVAVGISAVYVLNRAGDIRALRNASFNLTLCGFVVSGSSIGFASLDVVCNKPYNRTKGAGL